MKIKWLHHDRNEKIKPVNTGKAEECKYLNKLHIHVTHLQEKINILNLSSQVGTRLRALAFFNPGFSLKPAPDLINRAFSAYKQGVLSPINPQYINSV